MNKQALKDIAKQIGITIAVSILTPVIAEHAEKGIEVAKKGVLKIRTKLGELKGKVKL